jgi:transcriptional accessory protein Tex/SPT6
MTKTLLEKARETNNEESLNKNMEVETFLRENVDNLFTDADSYNFWVRDRKNLEHLLCGIYLSAESDLSEFDEITQYFTKVVTNKKNTRVDIIKQ